MKSFIVPVVVIAAVGVRLWLRSKRRNGRSDADRRSPPAGRREGRGRLAILAVGGDTALVAGREIRERIRARAFRVVTALLLVAVALAVLLPVLTRSKAGVQHVGVVGTLSSSETAAVLAAAKSVGVGVDVVAETGRSAAEADLRDGRVELVLLSGGELLVDKPISPTDTSATARLTVTVAAVLGLQRAFTTAGLSPSQAGDIASAKPLTVSSLTSASTGTTQARGTSIFGVIIVFVMLSQYETWTLIGVMEEKSSRVAEVLLATVRPIELLGGKVVGIGLVALGQAATLLGFGLVLAEAVGSGIVKGTSPLMLAAALLWLVVGYAFYCWVYAAAGSLAERQDQVQTLALPLSLPMLVGYIMALTTAASGHPSMFFQVLAYLPPTAPFAMPVMVGLGAVSWYGFVASVLISVVATVGVARLAATVYRRAVLRTGRRVPLREVLRSSAR